MNNSKFRFFLMPVLLATALAMPLSSQAAGYGTYGNRDEEGMTAGQILALGALVILAGAAMSSSGGDEGAAAECRYRFCMPDGSPDYAESKRVHAIQGTGLSD